MNNDNKELRDPAELRLHPLLKKFIPEPDRQSAGGLQEWQSFVDGLSAAGPEGVPEIFITADGQIMEGGRRWRAAKQLGWTEIRCRVRPEEDAAALIVESLLGQRNMQRCAKVYIALTLLEPFVASAERRRLENLKNGVKTLEKPLSSNLTGKREDGSTRDLAEKFGVSHETVSRAKQVVELFEKEPQIKAQWEPKLLCGEKNLWNVLSAVGGSDPKVQEGREGKMAFTQMSLVFDRVAENAEVWDDTQKRDSIINKWRKAASKIPAKLRKAMIEVLEQA